MKKTLLFALALAGASAFAQQSDTTFTMIRSNRSKAFKKFVFLQSFDMGELNGKIYLFYKVDKDVVALPMEFPARMMVYPEENHQYKFSEFRLTERYENM